LNKPGRPPIKAGKEAAIRADLHDQPIRLTLGFAASEADRDLVEYGLKRLSAALSQGDAQSFKRSRRLVPRSESKLGRLSTSSVGRSG
jgi:hypothetical protein